MNISIKSIALLVAFSLLFASNAYARSAAAPVPDEPSRTEKVLGALAVGAIAGIAYYALKDNDHHRYRDHRYGDQRHRDRYYRDQRHRGYDRRYGRGTGWSGYIAFSNGFTSLMIGSPYHHYRGPVRGHWQSVSGYRFYRQPYRYNQRYCRAYNSGWERGYWAGYIQGMHDARNRGQCRSSYQHGGGHVWGYDRSYGDYNRYSNAFGQAYSSGYNHAYYGHEYGQDNFGQGGYYQDQRRDYGGHDPYRY